MKKLQKIFIGIILFLSFNFFCIGCRSHSQLPDSWQADMVLKITYGGGMRDYSSTVEIKETGSNWLTEDGGKVNRDTILFDKMELDELLQLLRTENFDHIKTIKRDGIVHDKGTNTISLQWGKSLFEITISATETISPSDEANYQAIKKYIDNLLKKKEVKI